MRLLVDKLKKKTIQTERFIAKKAIESISTIKNGNLYFH